MSPRSPRSSTARGPTDVSPPRWGPSGPRVAPPSPFGSRASRIGPTGVSGGGWGGLGWAAPAGRWVPAGRGRRRPLPTPKPSARLHAGARRRPEPTRRAGRRFPPPTAQPRGPAASTDSPRAPFWPAAVRSCGDSSRHAAPGRRSGAGHEQPPAAPPSRLAARGRAVRGPAARRHARNARSRGGARPRFPLSAGAASAAPVTS